MSGWRILTEEPVAPDVWMEDIDRRCPSPDLLIQMDPAPFPADVMRFLEEDEAQCRALMTEEQKERMEEDRKRRDQIAANQKRLDEFVASGDRSQLDTLPPTWYIEKKAPVLAVGGVRVYSQPQPRTTLDCTRVDWDGSQFALWEQALVQASRPDEKLVSLMDAAALHPSMLAYVEMQQRPQMFEWCPPAFDRDFGSYGRVTVSCSPTALPHVKGYAVPYWHPLPVAGTMSLKLLRIRAPLFLDTTPYTHANVWLVFFPIFTGGQEGSLISVLVPSTSSSATTADVPPLAVPPGTVSLLCQLRHADPPHSRLWSADWSLAFKIDLPGGK